MNRVAVTGMGVISPVGNDVPAFWENIKAGTCGIGPITRFDTADYRVSEWSELPNVRYFYEFFKKREAEFEG